MKTGIDIGKEKKKIQLLIIITVVLAITSILVTLFFVRNHQDDVTSLNEIEFKLQTTEGEVALLKQKLDVANGLLEDTQKILTECKENPVDMSGDALLERDIFIYIDKKFQLIPRTASEDIAKQIIIKSRAEGVSPELVVGIIEVESAFNPSAVSSANARGLMQVMPEWAKKFGLKKVSDLHDIDTGIECGIKVLKIHIEEEGGDLTDGLFKYVGGSDVYAGKVFTAMGKFVAYRSTIPNDQEKGE